MTTSDHEFNIELNRASCSPFGGVIGATASLIGTAGAEAAPVSSDSLDPRAPPVPGLHLQFGADASSEMLMSW
jgi:hypothetical protein